jgi:hypothetical protein
MVNFFNGNKDNNKYVFETMGNALIFHNYMIFCLYNMLLNEELGDWVKARPIITNL